MILGKIKEVINQHGIVVELWRNVVGFCLDTNIHGIRYFAEPRRHWSERLWWFVAVTVSLYVGGSSIQDIVINWHQRPTKMEFADEPALISSIPFPTVTICPTVVVDNEKANAHDFAEFFLKAEKSTEDELSLRAQAQAIKYLCYNGNLKNETRNLLNGNILSEMGKIAPSSVSFGNWNRKMVYGAKFASILTEFGICYAFNGLNAHETYTEEMSAILMDAKEIPNISHWSADDGYEEGIFDEIYPRRISNVSPKGALFLFLNEVNANLKFKCFDIKAAFYIFLSAPGEMPALSQTPIIIYTNELTSISIKPKLITTSDGLRSYTPDQRKCFFNFERRLRFYQIYTQKNCEEECLSNYVKAQCGCIPLHMIRDNHTNVCTVVEDKKCNLFSIRKSFQEHIINEDLSNNEIKDYRVDCNCLPACTSITYRKEIERSQYIQVGDSQNAFGLLNVDIFFQEPEVLTMTRTERYNFSEFFAIGGGLLGLFLGISLLSIVELIYYFTLRLFWNVFKWKSDRVEPKRAPILPVVSRDIPRYS